MADRLIQCTKLQYGADYVITDLNIYGQQMEVPIWDTSGNNRYDCISSSYFEGVQCALLVYDITSRESFNNINQFIVRIRSWSKKKLCYDSCW